MASILGSFSNQSRIGGWDGAGGVEREGELVPPQKKQGTQARISQRTEPHALPDWPGVSRTPARQADSKGTDRGPDIKGLVAGGVIIAVSIITHDLEAA